MGTLAPMCARVWWWGALAGLMQLSACHTANPSRVLSLTGVDAGDGGRPNDASLEQPPLTIDAAVAGSVDAQVVLAQDAASPPAMVDAADASPPLVVSDASSRPRLRVGVQPSPAWADAGIAATDFARLEAFSLGSKVLTVVTDHPHEELEVLELADQSDVDVILTFPVREWDLVAAKAWVDEALALNEQAVLFQYLIIGQRLDRQLEASEHDQSARLSEGIALLLQYIAEHPLREPSTEFGIGVANTVDLPPMWVSGAPALALSWSGLDDSGTVITAELGVEQLSAFVASASLLKKTLIFQDLAYPGEEDSGALQQAEFYARWRDRLTSELAESVRAMVVSTLNDPSPSVCADWTAQWYPQYAQADAQAFESTESLQERRCTIGLRDNTGQGKPALMEVVGLLAEFGVN